MTWLTGPSRHLLLYALGGGLGHLTRTLALARRALRRGHRISLLLNTRYAPLIPYRRELPGAHVLKLSETLDGLAVGRHFDQLLARAAPDAVLVDTFPRGLDGELQDRLPRLPMAKFLTHRFVSQEYVLKASLWRFARHYHSILVPGEPAPLAELEHAVITAPWLVRDADELLPYAQARTALAAPGDRPIVAVVGCGRDREIDEARAIAAALRERLAERAFVRFTAPGEDGAVWPLLPLLPAVDLVVGAGGYNLVHECRATGTPLLAIARPRLYDRQDSRLRAHERVADARAAVERTCVLIESAGTANADIPEHLRVIRPAIQRPHPGYINGTEAAIQHIEVMIAAAS